MRQIQACQELTLNLFQTIWDTALRRPLRGSIRNRDSGPGALGVLIALCLVLLLLLTVVHAAQAHALASDADHCPVCVAMHSVLPLLIMLVAILLIRLRVAALTLDEVRVIIRYWHPDLFTRPPPIGC